MVSKHGIDRYKDLREAIASQVVKYRTQDIRIIGGDERSPVDWLFDFRSLLLQPKWLDRYAEIFWEHYASHYPFQVCGMETAAISLVAAIVMKGVQRGTPVNGVYTRKSRKRQGMLRQIEGTLNGNPIILVDDLIHSGSTFDKQLKILSDVNAHVSDIFVLTAFRDISTYRFPLAPDIRIKHLFTLQDFGLPMEKVKSEENLDAFETLWRFQAPNPLYNIVLEKSAPVIDDQRIYFGADNGIFYALKQSDGSIDWTYTIKKGGETNSIFSSPLLHKGILYFGASDGSVYALDAATGGKRWEYSGADWVRSSPALNTKQGVIYIGMEFGLLGKQGCLVALDAKTGMQRWRSPIRAAVQSSPLFIGREDLVVIGDSDGIIHAYDASSGALRWQYGTEGPIYGSFVYDTLRRLICFGSSDGTLYALFAFDGSPVFAKDSTINIHSTPIIHDRVLYFSSLDKKLYAINLDTGEDMWSFATKGRIFCSPTFIDGSIWIGSNDGRVYGLDPTLGFQKSFFQASERIVNKLVWNEKTKRFFLPTHANQILCLVRK
ncbi:MAG TPA: PQQ-binding-like beta-propeller repeat protein [Candidatus Paceibacterota bacterium]|nr:PQQ-binding-like beta-propeller repeat protein [Candidatus Paceibacterota bacterium]